MGGWRHRQLVCLPVFKKKQLKIGLSVIGKMYVTCALLANARACLYGNNTSTFFNLETPDIEHYFA